MHFEIVFLTFIKHFGGRNKLISTVTIEKVTKEMYTNTCMEIYTDTHKHACPKFSQNMAIIGEIFHI